MQTNPSKIYAARSADLREFRDFNQDRERRAAERERYWARKQREATRMALLVRGF